MKFDITDAIGDLFDGNFGTPYLGVVGEAKNKDFLHNYNYITPRAPQRNRAKN
jgi:hypothetical protein